MHIDRSPTFEAVRGDGPDLVLVHLEHLQRWGQCWDPGELVVIKVQPLQKGHVLHDTQH